MRQRRRLNSANKSFLCSICRTIKNPAEVSEKDKRYWLDRYPIEWIVETGYLIWGDPDE